MKKICILSLLLSLVSFSKGYVETYGKFYVESNGNNKVDKAGVRFNLEQGKFKFKTNIGVDELYFKEIDRDVAYKEKRKLIDYPKYLNYYSDLNGYMYNVKQNVAKASKVSLEYAMIRDEKADATLKIKAKSEDFGNIYREYVQLGADVAFKFKGGVKLGLDNKLNCYTEKEQRLRTQNKIYLDVNISNKANIKTSFGIDHFNEKAKKNYPEYDVTDWGSENNLYFTTGFDFNVKANENVNIDGKFATIKSYNTTLKPYEHLNYFGVGDYRKLYTEEETGYLCEAYYDKGNDELMPQNFNFNSVDLDNNRKPGSVFKSYLKVQYVNKDFKIKVMPFVNAIFNYVTYEKYNGVIYGLNTEISNKFLNKYLLGSKVRIVETLRNSYLFSKGNFLDLNVYSAYDGKINDKLTLIPKIRFEYLNRHLKHTGIIDDYTKFYNEYFLHRLKGEVGLELKYNVTNNLMLNAEAIAGLKFAKGEYKFISRLKENILSDKVINEYLKLNFNMKYEWK
ncbi:hypothetical protein [Sneathia sanguinegens]|jgi:hypothetical protein|uniref:hypothetical protein n=1 Tax=Sneathia sanguinegens TaxID=40543 RepID=UPI00288A9B6A|nr:hypothetical protein [Sneathia sanguinegens]